MPSSYNSSRLMTPEHITCEKRIFQMMKGILSTQISGGEPGHFPQHGGQASANKEAKRAGIIFSASSPALHLELGITKEGGQVLETKMEPPSILPTTLAMIEADTTFEDWPKGPTTPVCVSLWYAQGGQPVPGQSGDSLNPGFESGYQADPLDRGQRHGASGPHLVPLTGHCSVGFVGLGPAMPNVGMTGGISIAALEAVPFSEATKSLPRGRDSPSEA